MFKLYWSIVLTILITCGFAHRIAEGAEFLYARWNAHQCGPVQSFANHPGWTIQECK